MVREREREKERERWNVLEKGRVLWRVRVSESVRVCVMA